jgi:hypothetical protein
MRTLLFSLMMVGCVADNSPAPAEAESAISVYGGRCSGNMLALYDQTDFQGTRLCLTGAGTYHFSSSWTGTRSFNAGSCGGHFTGFTGPFAFSEQADVSNAPLLIVNAFSVTVVAEPDAAFTCP